MRVSSITTSQLVDQFRHIGRQIAPKLHILAGQGVGETQLGGVQRLPRKAESIEIGAKGFGGSAIGRVSQ